MWFYKVRSVKYRIYFFYLWIISSSVDQSKEHPGSGFHIPKFSLYTQMHWPLDSVLFFILCSRIIAKILNTYCCFQQPFWWMKLLEQSKSLTMMWYIILTVFAGYIIYKWMQEYCSPLYDIPEPPRYGILRHLPYFMKTPDNVELVGKWGEQFNPLSTNPTKWSSTLKQFNLYLLLFICPKCQFFIFHYLPLFEHYIYIDPFVLHSILQERDFIKILFYCL